MKSYNPFEKVDTLNKSEMLVINTSVMTDTPNGRRRVELSTGRISLDRFINLVELQLLIKKLNPYFSMYVSLQRALEAENLIDNANRNYSKFDKSLLWCYSVDFPATFVDKDTKQLGPISSVRHFNIYTRVKSNLGESFCLNYIKKSDVEIMSEEKKKAILEKLDEGQKTCYKILNKYRFDKRASKIFVLQIFNPYYRNVEDIFNVCKEIKDKRDLFVKFDIDNLVDRSLSIVIDTLNFLLIRRWLTKPKLSSGKKFKGKNKVINNNFKKFQKENGIKSRHLDKVKDRRKKPQGV